RNGLWLVKHNGMPHAVCCAAGFQYSAGQARHQLTVQVASPPDESAQAFGRQLLQKLEQVSQQLPSYRGKILSLELVSDWEGTGGDITVPELHPVSADQLILPDVTVELLERNVIG